MIEIISEHSIDVDMLPAHAKVLDLGCRGFGLSDHHLFKGNKVIGVDIDSIGGDREDFYQVAITDYNGKCAIFRNNDPQATRISAGDDIDCYTLERFSEIMKVAFWDLIKIDIEGAEYEVILSLTKAPARQLSIEFHLHTGIYTEKQVDEMVVKLEELGYEAVQHEKTSAHGAGFNYWDSLFILK